MLLRVLVFVGVLIAGLTAWFFVLRARMYRRLFADEHFLEIARAVPACKAAAFMNPLAADTAGPLASGDRRLLRTPNGLAIVYTVHGEGDRYVHHVSVSLGGGYTARAVGANFLAFFAHLVGLPIGRMQLTVGQSTVHHGELTVDRAEHERLAATAVQEVLPGEVTALRTALLEPISAMRWEPSDTAGR